MLPTAQIVPDLMQPFLLLALFRFCGLAISQTKVLNLVSRMASIPQSNVKSYTMVNFPQTHSFLTSIPHFGGWIFNFAKPHRKTRNLLINHRISYKVLQYNNTTILH